MYYLQVFTDCFHVLLLSGFVLLLDLGLLAAGGGLLLVGHARGRVDVDDRPVALVLREGLLWSGPAADAADLESVETVDSPLKLS